MEQITDKIRISNCDNMELMAQFPDNYFELAIVDPPYGGNDAIGLKDNKKTINKRQKELNILFLKT